VLARIYSASHKCETTLTFWMCQTGDLNFSMSSSKISANPVDRPCLIFIRPIRRFCVLTSQNKCKVLIGVVHLQREGLRVSSWG
jgi:hypothetical protein